MAGFDYRVRQFFQSAGARPLSESDLKQVRAHLPRAAFTLFQTMPRGDQLHSLTMLRSLLAQGHRAMNARRGDARRHPVSDYREVPSRVGNRAKGTFIARRERPLLQAALLHDVAKSHIGLGHRTGVILLNAISKNPIVAIVPHLASSNPRSWRYPFYLSLHHPELGAEMAARAGLDPRTVTLIRQHQSQPPRLSNTEKVRHVPHDAERELVVWQRLLKTVDDQK